MIAVANQKGGVGKTTTAVNLATALAAAERRTLLVDLDPQANTTTGVGFDSRALETTVYQALIDQTPLGELILPAPDLEYLHLVPANRDLAGAETELVSVISRETRLRKALEAARGQYEFVLIDCPPSLGHLTVNALTAADSVLIPLQCEYYALEGVTDLMHTIELIRDSLNPALRIEGIVMTMYDKRNNLSQAVMREVESHLGDLLLKTVIPRNVRLSEAPSHGKPILLYDIHSSGARSYMSLARELLERPHLH